jgi:hypothetical protein
VEAAEVMAAGGEDPRGSAEGRAAGEHSANARWRMGVWIVLDRLDCR